MEFQKVINIKYDDIFLYLEVDHQALETIANFCCKKMKNPFLIDIYENEKNYLIPNPILDDN